MKRWSFCLLCLLTGVSQYTFCQNYPVNSEVDSLISLGIKKFSNEPEEARRIFYEAVRLSEADDYSKGIARGYHLIAQLLLRAGQQDSVLVLLQLSDSLYRELDDRISRGKILLTQGDVFLQAGNYSQSLKRYTEALNLLEKQEDHRLILAALRRLGDFLMMTDEDEKAAMYFDRALTIAKNRQDTAYFVRFYISLGNLNSKKRNPDDAQSYLDSALTLNEYLSYRQRSAIYNSLGIVHYDQEDFGRSATYHLQSKKLKEDLQDSVGLANTWMNLGNTYEAMGQFGNAISALQTSYDFSDRLGLPHLKRTALLNLSRIYQNRGDYRKALLYDNLYDSLNQLLFDREKASELDAIREEFDAERREAQIQLLQKNEEVQRTLSDSRLQQRNSLIVAMILLTIILGLIYFAYIQKRRSNGQLREQNIIISRREKEKELLLHEVNHRVKNNLQMVGSLLRLQSHDLADQQAADAVKEGQARVEALMLIHKKIFEHNDHKNIRAPEYFTELVENLMLSTEEQVQTKIQIDDIQLDVDQVVPMALIVNELITNAIKYVFATGQGDKLEFSMIRKEHEISLTVKDNGNDSPHPEEVRQSGSFGINLVFTLTQQINGHITLNSSNGTHWLIVFPEIRKV